jgi:hypothetical protein
MLLVSYRGEEYSSGAHKEWDVDPKFLDLELSHVALNIDDGHELKPLLQFHDPLVYMHFVLFFFSED